MQAPYKLVFAGKKMMISLHFLSYFLFFFSNLTTNEKKYLNTDLNNWKIETKIKEIH